MSLREKVWNLLEARHDKNKDGSPDLDWLDKLTISLIVLNVLAIIFATVPAYMDKVGPAFWYFQIASVVYFTLEYTARVWSCTADDHIVRPIHDRLAYMFSPMGIIDLLSIAPFLILLVWKDADPGVIKFLMLFRLFWLFKLARYSRTVGRLDDVVRSRGKELAAAFGFVIVLIIIAAAGVWFFEASAQPDKFGTIPMSMWWAVVTLTTIGYGDVFPITLGGRMFASLVALAGIGMIALPAGILASAFQEEFRKTEEN